MRVKTFEERKGGICFGGAGLLQLWLVILAVAIVSLSCLAFDVREAAAAAEMLTNTNFNGGTNWTPSGATYDGSTTHTADGSGSYYVTISGRLKTVSGTLIQNVSIPATSVINTVSLWHKLSTNYETTGDSIVVEVHYVNLGTWASVLNTGELTNHTTFAQATASPALTLTDDVDQVRITLNTASGSNNSAVATLWVDDVSLQATTPSYTEAGSASASAASTTSILVSMPYQYDGNGNSTCTTRYKLSNVTTWTTGPSCTHSSSPLTVTIPSLTANNYYDVEMTYVDGDGVNGTAVQTATAVLLGPSAQTTPYMATVRVLYDKTTKDGTILVRMPYGNDTDNTSTYTLEYKLSSDSTWTTLTGSPFANEPGGLFKKEITGLQMDKYYDVRATYTDATDSVVSTGFGAVQTYTNILMNPTLHNSYNTSMRKWGGKWGVQGGQYGEFVCTTCHERGASNIKRIKSSGPIHAPDTSNGDFPGSATIVVLTNTLDGTAEFGDDTTAHSSSNKICEVCHSQPQYHKFNQPTATTHFNQQDCMQCHNHSEGFYQAGGQCMKCHDAAQNQLYDPRQIVESSPGAGDGDFVKLSRHVSNGTTTQIVTNYDCVVCHREGDADIVASGDGWIDLYNHKNGTSKTTRYVMLRNVDNINTGWKWNKYDVNDQMRTDMDSFCLSCHDSNGASGINVNATGTGLNLDNTRALTPFNPNDTLTNGHDGFVRSRVVDVKSQFYPGTQTGANYDGNPSQHAVLGARYSTPDANWTAATWTGHVDRKGQTMSTARETATLHCSDCHLCETNAHGAANSWHMLVSSTSGDFTTDKAQTVDADVVCYKCHSSTYYSATTQTTGTRIDHNIAGHNQMWGNPYGGSNGAKLGPVCLLCHGGDGFGHIHGRGSPTDSDGDGTFAGSTYTPAGGTGTYTKERFMPGAWMQFKPGTNGTEADWTTGGLAATCYFPASSQWSNCTQHSNSNASASGWNTNYGRATKY